MAHDIEYAANSELADALLNEKSTASDLIAAVEDVALDFDFDSFAPYTHEEEEILNEYERDYAGEAENYLSGAPEFNASQWAEARRSYAAAVAAAAFSSILGNAKQELIEAIESFNSEMEELMDDEPEITISHKCIHGWAAHDREDHWDNTHYWENGQLDGCNGAAIKVGELWLSVCYTPKAEEPDPARVVYHEQTGLSHAVAVALAKAEQEG